MTDSGYSLSDIQAVTDGGNRGGMFGGDGIWGFILIFFILAIAGNGFGGFGFGGNPAGVTRADLSEGFSFNNINRELLDIGNGIAQSNYVLTNRISECCCNNQLGLAENRYASERNTCNIVNAIHADGEATRALINSNTMQELRDRLEQAEREKLQLHTQLGTQAAVAEVVGELRPCAKPAYITCSPYVANYQYGGCGGYNF